MSQEQVQGLEGAQNALREAIENNNTSLVEQILTTEENFDVNFLYPDENMTLITPLVAACIKVNPKICEILLKKGANPHMVLPPSINYSSSLSPLHIIVRKNTLPHLEIAKLLLLHNANPDHDQFGQITALQTACLHGAVEMVQLLLEYNASTGDVFKNGHSALRLAAHTTFGTVETKQAIINLLIPYSLNINIDAINLSTENKNLIKEEIVKYKAIGSRTKAASRENEIPTRAGEDDTEVEEGTPIIITSEYEASEYEPEEQNVATSSSHVEEADAEESTTTTSQYYPVGTSLNLSIDDWDLELSGNSNAFNE